MPANGRSMNTNSVSCHEIIIIVPRHTIIITGFLNIMSSDAMMEFSISATSPLMRAITSPLRSEVKNEMGRAVILSYTKLRMSRTIPERSGIMKYELRKVVPVFSPVIITRATASMASVADGPNRSIHSCV